MAHDESPRATSKADGGSLLDEHERAATEMDKSRPSVNQSDGPPTSVGSGVDGCTSSGNLSCTPSVASPGNDSYPHARLVLSFRHGFALVQSVDTASVRRTLPQLVRIFPQFSIEPSFSSPSCLMIKPSRVCIVSA